MRVETYSIPFEAGDRYFSLRPRKKTRPIYVRKLTGADERLIDANKLSADENTNVSIADVANDGSLLLYAVREGGADEETIHILDVNSGKESPEVLPRARYLGVSLTPDKKGIYYSKFEDKVTQVYLHRMGTAATADQRIFGGSFNGETFGAMQLITCNVSENGRYLLIDVNHGVPPKRVDIYVKDLRSPDAPIRPIIHGIDSRFVAANYEDDLYVLTDYQAENYRIVRIKLSDPAPEHWQTIVPEGKNPISQFSIVGGKLFATGLHDVVSETRIFDLSGKQVGNITYPTLGAASAVFGRQQSKQGFYNFQSFNIPPTIYHYNVDSGKTEVFARSKVPFNSEDYEVKQVFYTSKDGTRVPMFISSKKGVKRDGTIPTLMFAYGGFLVDMTPAWSPEYAWWMEQGGYYAQPNLRGGGEYGEAWHKGNVRAQAECVRRLLRRGALPYRQQVQLAATPCHSRALQWRSADGSRDDPASRTIRRNLVWLSTTRHAEVSELSRGPLVDIRVRFGGNCGAVPLPAEILSVPQCEAGHELPGYHVQHRRLGYACRSAARA